MDCNVIRDHLISLDRAPGAPAAKHLSESFERQEFTNDHVLNSWSPHVFVCADYGIECVFYVIDLDNASHTFGHVYSIGATHAGLTATRFSEFIMKVAEDHDDLHNDG